MPGTRGLAQVGPTLSVASPSMAVPSTGATAEEKAKERIPRARTRARILTRPRERVPMSELEDIQGCPRDSLWGGCVAIASKLSCTGQLPFHPGTGQLGPGVTCGFKTAAEAMEFECPDGNRPFVFAFQWNTQSTPRVFNYVSYVWTTKTFIWATTGGEHAKAKWGPTPPRARDLG